MADHQSSFQTESATAELIEILKTRTKQIHNHDIDTLFSGALLARPQALRETFQMMPVC